LEQAFPLLQIPPLQQGWFVPPQATQVPLEQTPTSQNPLQQGSPMPPQLPQVPLEQVNVRLPQLPPGQQAWPDPPQLTHCPVEVLQYDPAPQGELQMAPPLPVAQQSPDPPVQHVRLEEPLFAEQQMPLLQQVLPDEHVAPAQQGWSWLPQLRQEPLLHFWPLEQQALPHTWEKAQHTPPTQVWPDAQSVSPQHC
jgi:hypothetical protein